MTPIARKAKRQNRPDIITRICNLSGVTKEQKTPGYFSRNQLLNLVTFLERVTKHEPVRPECD